MRHIDLYPGVLWCYDRSFICPNIGGSSYRYRWELVDGGRKWIIVAVKLDGLLMTTGTIWPLFPFLVWTVSLLNSWLENELT